MSFRKVATIYIYITKALRLGNTLKMKRITERRKKNTSDSGIYTITNIINGRVYIGSTFNLTLRNSQQVYLLRRNKHTNQPLQDDFNQYGEDNFIYEIIERGEYTKQELLEREAHYFNFYNNKYNICNPLSGVSNVKSKTIKVTDIDGNIIGIVTSGVEYTNKYNHSVNYKLINSGKPQKNQHILYHI